MPGFGGDILAKEAKGSVHDYGGLPPGVADNRNNRRSGDTIDKGVPRDVSDRGIRKSTSSAADLPATILLWLTETLHIVDGASNIANSLLSDYGCQEPSDIKHLGLKEIDKLVYKHNLKKAPAGRLRQEWRVMVGMIEDPKGNDAYYQTIPTAVSNSNFLRRLCSLPQACEMRARRRTSNTPVAF